MRLTQKEHDIIVDEAGKCFGPKAHVVLFGSRTDDNRRGGDIDLLIQGIWEQPEAFHRKVRFLVDLKYKLGEQHIDVVLAAPDDQRLIVREAIRTGVVL